MKIEMEKVFERDIDLLMINKFCNDKSVVEYFCSRVGISSYQLEVVQHSVVDENGESDITIILNNGINKVAFLIEDKIDAIAMPNQRDRYDTRGNSGIQNQLYDKFFVFIIAPRDYLITNIEAQKYENKISYEELIELLDYDVYAKSLFKQAIEEKKKGYIIIENENVTSFWQSYYKYVEDNYSMLSIKKNRGPRGNNACWPIFNTQIKQIKIKHKSDRGFVDLEFPKMSGKYIDFYNLVINSLDADMDVFETGKSVSIRLLVPKLNFRQEFADYMNEMKISMDSIVRLQNLLKKLNLKEINKLTNRR